MTATRVRTAWEARKQIGPVVADGLREITRLRNEAARAVGFPDYWHAQLLLDELDPERLIETLEQVDASTRAPFQAMKADPATKHIPVVFLTSDDDVEERSGKIGAEACLKKPVKADRLLALVGFLTR